MSDSTRKTISIKIAIDIPVEVAAETFAQIEPLVNKLSQIGQLPVIENSESPSQLGLVTPQSDSSRELDRSKMAENLKRFKKYTVQAYRTFRRISDDFERPYDAYKVLADKYEWPVTVLQTQIASRRKHINQYIKKRRMATIIRLKYHGWTYAKIAEYTGIHDRTVARLARAALKERK